MQTVAQRRAVRTRMPGGVGGVAPRGVPPIPIKHLRWSRPICANPALAARGHEARDRNRAAQVAPDLARLEASLYQFAFMIVNQRIIILTRAGPRKWGPAIESSTEAQDSNPQSPGDGDRSPRRPRDHARHPGAFAPGAKERLGAPDAPRTKALFSFSGNARDLSGGSDGSAGQMPGR